MSIESAASDRPTIRGRRTEQAFHDAARAVIMRKGFLNTTINDIAAEANRSPASFYNYFDSKEDLLVQWAVDFQREARERSIETFRPDSTRHERVESAVRAHWVTFKDHLAELVGVFQFSMVNDDFAARWNELTEVAVGFIASRVERAQAEGYCPTAHPVLIGKALTSMLNHFAFAWFTHYDESLPGEFDEEAAIATLADIWYHSIYWYPGDASPT